MHKSGNLKLKPLILFTLAIVVLTGCTQTAQTTAEDVQGTSNTSNQSTVTTMDTSKADKYSAAPAKLNDVELKGRKATIKTSKGDIVVELYGDIAPLTVSNFIFLANEKFYDGLIFHRREEGFVVQGGDPLGTGTGGPGYTVPAEISDEAKHIKGAIAMARLPDQINPEKASSGSQFYITLEATPFLDSEYTVFGKVVSGMDVVEQIQIGDKIMNVTIE